MSRLEKNMDDLHIGVIGSGGRGNLVRNAHKPGEGSRVVACCDIMESVLDHNREWYGDDIYTTVDYHQLLQQDLDAVFVCSPDFLHQEHALLSPARQRLKRPSRLSKSRLA